MNWQTMTNRELLEALDNKLIGPAKIVGGGYKSSAIARRVAREYLLEQIAKESEVA
jgi:hypothetical protein